MNFPSYISNTFRIIVCVILAWEIIYLIMGKESPGRLYQALVKMVICFTALISYINDKEKMLVVKNNGFLVEPMVLDEKTLKEKFSFLYLIIILIYNPVLSLFSPETYWLISDALILLFLGYKIGYYRKYSNHK